MAPRKKKILIGSAVRQDAEVLKRHVKTLLAQELPPGVEVEYVFVDDCEGNEASVLFDLIPGVQVLPGEPRPEDAVYRIGKQTHEWSDETFDHLAKLKQKLLDKVVEEGYDYAFLVDSDLMMDPRTLLSLYYADKPVTSAVFWTEWQAGDPSSLGPNVWLVNPYKQTGMGMTHQEFWKELASRKLVHVVGGGACHLIKRDVLEAGVRYYPRLQGLPRDNMWQGEDRTFSVLTERKHKMQFADPWPYVYHAYHPEDRELDRLDAVVGELLRLPQRMAKQGDLISFTVEALEDEEIADRHFCIRGRLGGLDMLPDMERELAMMEVGESNIVEVRFPPWWPVNAGQIATMRLRLLDVKPYGYAPTLIDHVVGG